MLGGWRYPNYTLIVTYRFLSANQFLCFTLVKNRWMVVLWATDSIVEDFFYGACAQQCNNAFQKAKLCQSKPIQLSVETHADIANDLVRCCLEGINQKEQTEENTESYCCERGVPAIFSC